ncbi:MAG: type I DNA topoisomerase [Dysgonamonadaceae bacterium]|nr:type I DNA topoisomerase [Dysgonamonadaceae bacterium]
MQKNLVIVESPAKAKTIEKFLGTSYTVMSSYGHIRDLREKGIAIDIKNNFKPDYVVSSEKKEIVNKLKKAAQNADMVWLASDEDREGEAISWHLAEVLGLDKTTSKRIVFHEITRGAILEAIENPRDIDLNLVDAQQARRLMDRIVGFELSPILWKKIMPSLSAGRVQSVAVRLIVEREKEINKFNAEAYFKVTAEFLLPDGKSIIKAELNRRLTTVEEVQQFLESIAGATFTVEQVITKPGKRSPAPPFTTSTLQQEAARKLGFSVTRTMSVAQKLYELGQITYMRTDSLNLSTFAIDVAKKEIIKEFGDKYLEIRQYHTKTKGAQEAHEAIRPTYIIKKSIQGSAQEQQLYELIWKRTIASQMACAEIERTTVTIGIGGKTEKFIATDEVVRFDGFLRVYREDNDDEAPQSEEVILPPVKEQENLNLTVALAAERLTQRPFRYTEASLVRKMEELGIGRPSTYAPTISTIQQRGYVEKGNKEGQHRQFITFMLSEGKVSRKTKDELVGADKGKLLPTDSGVIVNDFLIANFPKVLDYNFTANIEKTFDQIADGEIVWTEFMKQFYDLFHPVVIAVSDSKSETRIGERLLGTDPKSGKQVSVRIGRFGPYAQLGVADENNKPQFASLSKDKSIEDVTLEEALKLFDLPRTVGEIDGMTVTAAIGRFGPYIKIGSNFVSIPKGNDPLTITVDEAKKLLEEKIKTAANRTIKTFTEDPSIQILKGRFGPYISFNKETFKIPKDSDPAALTFEEVKKIIDTAPKKPVKKKRKK